MKRIQPYKHNNLLASLIKIFLKPSSNAQFVQQIFLLIEMVTFLGLVSSGYIDGRYVVKSMSQILILVILILILLARYVFAITLIRIVYLPCLIYLFGVDGQAGIKIAVSIFLFVNLVSEVLSRIQFEFKTQNPYSQSLNHVKFLHYFVLTVVTCFRYQKELFPQKYPWIDQLITLGLFLTLFIVKVHSTANNFLVKQIFLRFYLICIAYTVHNLIKNWTNYLNISYQNIIVLIVAQIIYKFFEYRFGKLQVQTEISNGNIVNLVFTLMSYQYGLNYDEKYIKALHDLSPEKIAFSKSASKRHKKLLQQEIVDEDLRGNYFQHQKKTQKGGKKTSIVSEIFTSSKNNKDIAYKAQQLLQQAFTQKTDSPFLCNFFISQIKFSVFENLIISKKILQKLKNQLSVIAWIDKICIYKFEQKIKKEIQRKYDLNYLINFEEFHQNEQLRTLVIKHSYEYMALWKYLTNTDFLFKKLTKLLVKVLKRNEEVQKMYEKIKIKCSTTIMLFIDYFYMVRRDIPQTLKLCRNFQIYPQSNHFLQVENKIYICVTLQQNILTFQNVSYNVKKWLGYERSIFKNSPISILMPQFFVQTHQKMVEEDLVLKNQVFYVMKKNVFVKHNDGYYCPTNIELKMVHSEEGNLMLEGFIEILPTQDYNWANYFIINSDQGQIIQIGPALKDLIDIGQRKQLHINQYFQSKNAQLYENQIPYLEYKKYLHSNGVQYEYNLLRELNTDSKKYACFVCKNTQDIIEESYGKGKFEDTLAQYLKYQKYPVKYEDFETNLEDYFNKKTQLIKVINQRTPCLVFLAIIILFATIFALQIVLIDRIEVTNFQNDQIKDDMSNMIQFYHALQNMGMIVNMYSVNMNLGVQYDYNYYNITTLCLDVQAMNVKLSKFNFKSYGTQGQIAIDYPKPLYELVDDVVSSFYINLFIETNEILTMSKNNLHNFFRYLFGQGFDDYLYSFSKQVKEMNDQDTRFKLILGCSIGILSIIIYFLIYKIDACERYYQYESLNLISSVNTSIIFVNSITEFLRRTTGNINEKQVYDYDSKSGDKLNQSKNFSTLNLSKNDTMSNASARENSVRGFFDEEVLNSTNRQHRNLNMPANMSLPFNTLELKQKIQQDETQRREQKIRPLSKKFVVLWTIIVLTVLGICAGSLISEQSGNRISLAKSVQNLLVILDKQILFASTVITYLDTIAYNSSSDLFMLNYQTYQEMSKQQTYFNQVGNQQFARFTSFYQNFTYVYVCEYMKCDHKFKSYIDILYYSDIQKLNDYMINNLDSDHIQNKTFEGQALWYSFYLLESTVYKLIKTYLQDYNEYQSQKSTIYYIFYSCEIVALIICLVVCMMLYCWKFKMEKKKCLNILDLVKKDSYNVVQPQN